MFEDYSKEQIEKNLKTVLTLEWLGVHIEDTNEVTDEYGILSKTVYYLSVPETSTIEVEDKELSKKIQSSDSLISLGFLQGCVWWRWRISWRSEK